jgi:hypothetical protein
MWLFLPLAQSMRGLWPCWVSIPQFLNVCKVRFLPCSHLGSDCIKLCCKNDGVLVSFYKPHLLNCLTHLIVHTSFFLVVIVVNSNLGFEMVKCWLNSRNICYLHWILVRWLTTYGGFWSILKVE